MEIGSIIKLKNIIFDRGNGMLDHAYKVGRPCVFIGEDNNTMYFLPIISKDKRFKHITLEPNKDNNLYKTSEVNVSAIIKKPIAFYEVTGKIKTSEILKIYKEIIKYYSSPIGEEKMYKVLEIASSYLENNDTEKRTK